MSAPVGLERAQAIVRRALEAAREHGVEAAVTVVDAGGHVITKSRMDGSALLSATVSEDKAYTAAITQMPTAEWAALVQPGAELYGLTSSVGGRFVAFGGGVPLHEDGRLVGAVGVSGGSAAQDVAIVTAAVHGWSVS